MKRNRSLKTRIGSTLLAAYMLFSLLPTSVFVFAADTPPLSVTWTPQEQVVDGVGTVALTAELSVAPEGEPDGSGEPDPSAPPVPVAAMVEITLDADEAAALSPISNSDQAVLLSNADGSAVLRVLLSGSNLSFSEALNFIVQDENDLSVNTGSADIKFQIDTTEAEVPADIATAELLTGNTGSATIDAPDKPFLIHKTLPKEISITAGSDITLGDSTSSQDIIYTLSFLDLDGATSQRDYSFTLTLPQSLTLPAGSLSSSTGSDSSCVITCGDVTLATLTGLPAEGTMGNLATTADGLSFTVSLPDSGDTIPTEISLAVHGDAFLRGQDAISDKMSLLVQNTAGGAAVEASVFVTADAVDPPGTDDQYTLQVIESKNFSQTVAWADNQSPNRPQYGINTYYPNLFFVIDGITRPLTAETLENVGLPDWPAITETPDGFTINLPTKLQEKSDYATGKTYEVTWYMEPPETPTGYAFVEVTEDNKTQYPSVNGQLGWYYMLQGTFTFILNAKQGDTILSNDQIETILNNFDFCWTFGDSTQSEGFHELLSGGNVSLKSVTITDDDGKPTTATQVTIDGLWLYNMDGKPLNFWLTEKADDEGSSSDRKLTSAELDSSLLKDPEDWFQISYKNTHNTSDTSAVYDGGTLLLLLSGNTTFSAEKVVLPDRSPGSELESRPDVTFTLWRYREGQSYTSKSQILEVSPVTYTNGGTPTCKVSGDGDEEDYTDGSTDAPSAPAPTVSYVPITFTDSTGNPLVLPKYDPDGYAYVYGVQESIAYSTGDNQYETLFGVVGSDDGIEAGSDVLPDHYAGGDTRSSGDALLYNGGVLSNRLKGTAQVPVTKKWEAAAYQAAFDDVAVELTLQSRVSGSTSENDWANVIGSDGTITCYLYHFTAERLSESYAVYAPKYNGQAQELEYRWVETGVYQGVNATSDQEVKAQIADGTAINCPLTGTGSNRTFSLTQKGTTVNYVSSVSTNGTIVNRIDDNLNYHVIKEWLNGTSEKSVTFYIYQVASGSADFDLENAYVKFSFDAQGNLITNSIACENTGVTVAQDQDASSIPDPWQATAYGLPRFDANGRPYEYILLETSGYPSYKTERDPATGDYTTTVFNGGPGVAIPILVRKVWLDDGDDLHREPVTFTVYNANTDQPLMDNGNPVTVTLQDGLWPQVVIVKGDEGSEASNPSGVYDVSDLYVVETSMGIHDVDHHLVDTSGAEALTKLALYGDGSAEHPGGIGNDGAVFDVTTDNHRYQVTYTYEGSTDAGSTSAGGVQGTFTVTNRRLGNIDLTAKKTWINGDSQSAFDEIEKVLQSIYNNGSGPKLALVLQLKFTGDNQGRDWKITTSGFNSGMGDTVYVGGEGILGEQVTIYNTYNETTGEYESPTSSLQALLELDDSGALKCSTEARFFGLPKYDSRGQVVEYTVGEIWVDVANPGTPVDLTQPQYSSLQAIWQEYTTDYETTYISPPDEHNTKDTQTVQVTNKRANTKNVFWYKVWKDDYSADNAHRPDIFLDLYRVVHVSDGNGGYQKQIQQVQSNVEWVQLPTDQTQRVSLSGMQKYDSFGFEILYYAVERTVVAVGDYDYQAVQYSIHVEDPSNPQTGITVNLGSRDIPAAGAVDAGRVLDLLNPDLWEGGTVPSALKDSIGTFENGGTPQYALVEEGTFTNTLADNYTIDGMKYWSSLPSGWPDARLPGVTFEVYRYTGDVQPGDLGQRVAWLTISPSDWENLKTGLSYRYLIQYEGANSLSQKTENGQTMLVCNGTDGATRLPRYDENGKLYTYLVKESVNWGTDVTVDAGDQVFESTNNAFTFTNTYKPTTGYIAVKKFLYLPMKEDGTPKAFPAVTFQLTRKVYVDGKYEEDTTFGTQQKVLSSAEVKTLYDTLADDSDGKKSGYITAYVVFDGLPLYAPDGRKYQYTVTEDKSELMGYDTWMQQGDVETTSFASLATTENPTMDTLTPVKGTAPADLSGKASVTFKNQQPVQPKVFNTFTGTKVWEDFEDTFGFRPKAATTDTGDGTAYETLLTLKRSAKSQTNQGNPMEEVLSFTLTYTSSTDGKTWNFKVEPVDNASFEMYAPNGMPWTYTLSEPLTEEGGKLQLVDSTAGQPEPDANKIYTPNPSDGIWPVDVTYQTKPGTDGSVSFGTLTNSIQTKAQFKKVWKDSDNQNITQDYLGIDLTVTFQLQVSTDNGTTWTLATANEHVMKAMGAGFTGIQTLTGLVNDTSKWSGSFTNLPAVVKDSASGQYTFLKYRVIETKVSYGGQEQEIKLPTTGSNGTSFTYDLASHGLVTDATFSQSGTTSISTNTLATMEVTVEKVWQDGGNPYNTRPGVDHPMTWTSWFVVRRTTDSVIGEDTVWENVTVVKLYGGNTKGEINGDRWQYTVTGLPTADYSGGAAVNYTYQVRELQPKSGGYPTVNSIQEGDIVPHGGTYNPDGTAYTTTYVESPANTWLVTNALTTSAEMTAIRAVKEWAGTVATKPSISFQLQYRTSNSANWAPVSGETHTKVVNDSNGWTAIWENLPKTIGQQEVQYRVVELDGSGWVQVAQNIDTATSTYIYTFTNTLTRDFTVEKVWNPSSSAAGSITVGLYRTTNSSALGLTTGEQVPVDEMDTTKGYRTATLTTGNWTYIFTGLPQYSAGGQLYYYYALEMDSSNSPIAGGSTITLGSSSYVVTYDTPPDNSKTTVTNTPATEMTGTKTWEDNGATNRPDVTLTLQRRTGNGRWQDVTGVTPTWDKPANSNTWIYTYTGLPTRDASGNLYEYRVLEATLPGYILKNQAEGQTNGVVASDTDGNYNFINTRAGLVDLTVIKTWVGDQASDRPSSITLKLERKTVNQGDDAWSEVAGVTSPTPDVSDNVWTYSYTGLPQFDSNGVAYQYRVTEVTTGEILSKYEVKDSANTDPTVTYQLENIRLGGLTVRKEVSGNSGETARDFHFTVVLSGLSLAGTDATTLTGTYAAVYIKQNGSTETKIIQFTNGVSESFALKHKESLTINGLPAGLTYTVTEAESNKEGYSTTSTGNGLTIPSGTTAEVSFENYRHTGDGHPEDRVDISGTKTWVDDSDAAGKRPADLELTLYRSVAGGKEVVVNAVPVWSKNGNVWTYTYRNLPKYDSNGNRYTYRVVETVPDGYVGQSSGFNFTNTLAKEFITLTGQKYWVGDSPEDRPDSITVVLYANGLEVRRLTVTAADNWQYVFQDMPKFDADGNEISYYVREEVVPEGYQVRYDGLNIINQKDSALGDLQVSKQVAGAEHDRTFSFTVTLSDTSISGTYGDLTFVNGVASFTLRHGQSVVATGLPAGISYTVAEDVPDGYTVSATGQTGVITQGTVVKAAFVNTPTLPTEPEEPGDHVAKTGDESNMALYALLTILFASGLILTLVLGKKGRKKGDRSPLL